MSQIDAASREIILMKYVQRLSYKEIGEILGITPKHVETKLSRAKEKVRKLYEQEVSDNE
jgi:RNA polymerase sigma factor (sigma-70 family)